MAGFVFQLEGILRHRGRVERQRQGELAQVEAQMMGLREEMGKLERTVGEANADLRQNRLVGTLDVGFIAGHRRFMGAMQRKAMAIAQKMALVQKQIDAARAALAEAAKQRKIIEKLKERRYEEWRANLNRRELAETDEIGMQLSYRQLVEDRAGQEESVGEA